MKAMLWKEWRENIKWAVLAMLALGLAEFYGLMQNSNYNYDESATICKSAFLMATTFGCAAVGIVLGLVQILPEQRRDQWAALLHRPVDRATIYRGKALAGLLLYLLATVPPFLACVWYTVTPGHFATPFVPQMLEPGVADIFAGAMYYFAALLVGLRRGAWYGSRAFGFLAAVTASFFISSGQSLFRLPLEAALGMSLILCLAGWGAILTNGTTRNQPWIARYALVTAILFGSLALTVLGFVMIGIFASPNYYYGSQYSVDVDGRPLKLTEKKNAGTVITDLAGNVIHDPRFNSSTRYQNMLGFANISSYIGNPHKLGESGLYSQGYRNNQTYVMPLAYGTYDTDTERWYYLPKQQQFVGYNFKTLQPIGAIGRDGFHPGREWAQPLGSIITQMGWEVPAVFQFGQTVYINAFDQRKIIPIYDHPETKVYGSGQVIADRLRSNTLTHIAIALSDQVLILDKNGAEVARLPYHQDMERFGNLNVAIQSTKDRFFLQYQPSAWIEYGERQKMPQYLEEMDAKGVVYNTYTLPPLGEHGNGRGWSEYLSESVLPPGFFFGDIAYDKIGGMCGSERLAEAYNESMTRGWSYTREVGTQITIVSLLLALVTLAWARRVQMTWKRAWTWAAFVFAFNIAGLITFRLAADWPVRVRCPKCEKPRLIETETCPHCQADWPAPVREGTEIFDSGGEQVSLAKSEAIR